MTSDAATTPTVSAIHIALASRLPMKSVESAILAAGAGIAGDRYENTRHRHVTIQSQTGLDDAAAELGAPISPADTRRNITISGGSVPSRPGERMRVGEVEVEVVRVAAPCKLLDDVIGDGAMVALRHRAGSVCRVLTGGEITLGASVDLPMPTTTETETDEETG